MAGVLVVDDEAKLGRLVAEALELDGHTVVRVGGGRAALTELSQRPYDVVLTDLKMPEVDGMAVLQSAQSLALARRHQQLTPEHLLKVLLEERDGLSRNLIKAAGGDPEKAVRGTDQALSKLPSVQGGSGQLYLKPETASVLRVVSGQGRSE